MMGNTHAERIEEFMTQQHQLVEARLARWWVNLCWATRAHRDVPTLASMRCVKHASIRFCETRDEYRKLFQLGVN